MIGVTWFVAGGGFEHTHIALDVRDRRPIYRQNPLRHKLALRLAYDATGQAIGVDLSGRVSASKAIISNLTLWDTYGKLIGLDHTASGIRKRFNNLRACEFSLGNPEARAMTLTGNLSNLRAAPERQQRALHSRGLDVALERRNEPFIGKRCDFSNIDADDEFREKGSRGHADGAAIASEASVLHDCVFEFQFDLIRSPHSGLKSS